MNTRRSFLKTLSATPIALIIPQALPAKMPIPIQEPLPILPEIIERPCNPCLKGFKTCPPYECDKEPRGKLAIGIIYSQRPIQSETQNHVKVIIYENIEQLHKNFEKRPYLYHLIYSKRITSFGHTKESAEKKALELAKEWGAKTVEFNEFNKPRNYLIDIDNPKKRYYS